MLRVTIHTTAPQGAPWYTNHYFGGSTDLEAAAAVDAVENFLTNLSNHRPSSISATTDEEVHQIDILTGQTTGIFPVTPVTVAGAHSAELLPWATQGLVRWRSGTFVAGRELRGRTFIPGMTEDYNTGGVPGGGLPALMAGHIEDFLTASSGAGSLVVYSTTHHEAAPVTNGSFWNQWAVMRSRRD